MDREPGANPGTQQLLGTEYTVLNTLYSAADANRPRFSRLLVSVRSAVEAVAALEGGADLIDVKEPSRGSLGRAGDSVIADVIQAVAGRKPVSAACGELVGWLASPRRKQGLPELQFVKWGLAGCGRIADWPVLLETAAEQLPVNCRPVAVAYADWMRAAAPPPEEVCKFTCDRHWGAFLLDTWQKDGMTLLDYYSVSELRDFVKRCRDSEVPIAQAGSLGLRQIEMLLPLVPDWFAVRGAACREQNRTSPIDCDCVRDLAKLVAGSACQGFLARTSG